MTGHHCKCGHYREYHGTVSDHFNGDTRCYQGDCPCLAFTPMPTASPAPHDTHCPSCGLPAESLHDETACNVIVGLRRERDIARKVLREVAPERDRYMAQADEIHEAYNLLRAERDRYREEAHDDD